MTAYAVGVAMNNFLPANLGTFATLVMFTAIIPACTFPGAIAAYLVQKIFFTVAGTFVYLYLFLSVPGSFPESFGNVTEEPLRAILIAAGAVFLIVILARVFWKHLKGLWEKAKQGGVILSRPKEYFTHSFLPSFASWLCKLAVIGIMLAAFTIPVTFESVMWVTGSGSLANVVSVTPGAVGITQATNALALDTCCDVAEEHRGRLLHRAAAHHDRLERRLRARARRLGLRLEGRQAARHAVVRGREGQGRRAEGRARREEGGEESRARRVRARPVPSPPRRDGGGGYFVISDRREKNMTPSEREPAAYGQSTAWQPELPRLRVFPLLVSWIATGIALLVAAGILPGVDIGGFWGALLVAAIVAALNAVIPPVLAALRLPLTLVLGFLLVLIADAVILLVAADVSDGALTVDNFGWALLAALVVAAVSVVLAVLLGSDDMGSIRIAQRIAKRQGIIASTEVPGIIYLEIDGLALPVLRRAMRDGNAPNMARWARETHRLVEWEPDLSSQTGASQAGILLGSNEDISAFRWVEKETATMMTCSAPPDCAEIERRRGTGIGLLVDGGASRGNLLSGEAEDVILTVSRMEAEKKSNPGYRAFFANGDNATRTLVLFGWEVILEWTAALRAIRRDVQPRGHRGGIYPLMRGAMCVFVRDLIVSGVLTDIMRGRPAVYATFSSYDEVAHHSGLERHDTLEALRKLDDHFAHIERACRYAPRPYEIVVLSDHGQTQGATFKQRNGYGLDELVERALATGDVSGIAGGDEQNAMVGNAFSEATGKKQKKAKNDVSDRDVVVMGSGNLGLIYLMEERRRLTMEEIDERHPQLLPALRAHPHVGWLLVRSSEHGAVALGGNGVHYLEDGRVEGEDPLAAFSPTAPQHLLRTDGFEHVGDIMVGSFYDPELDEGCAFEELISFHGGIGGLQTRPFILHPTQLETPPVPIIGAASVHGILAGWRRQLQGEGKAS